MIVQRPDSRPGNILVVTGPSGVGKGTVVERLLNDVPNLKRSVSVTTREKRAGEEEGISYFFRSPDEFGEMQRLGRFLEWAEFAGGLYGTPRDFVQEQIKNAIDVILEIEVQGAMQVAKVCPEAVLIFLSPPSFEALEDRLKKRATETPEKIAMRLNKARQELAQKHLFDYEVINADVDKAVEDLTHIIFAERCKILDTNRGK